MAIRPIDANALHAEISKWPEPVMYKDWVQSAIATAPTLTPPNEWVSVEEKLPEKDGSYLVHSGKSNTVYAAHFWKRDGRWSGKSKNLFITHWMPMPELPERSNNETD